MALKQPCQQAVKLPERDLDGSEVARSWAQDRTALGDCGSRHRALAEAATALEGQGQ